MITIKQATEVDIEVLARLGRQTWEESHGQYIDDKNELLTYLDQNFSIGKTTQDLHNPKYLFYILYVDDLPAGYAKIELNAIHNMVASENNCKLERIFILKDFIPLKIGQQLLTFVEDQARALQLDTMWLTVYILNDRAIRFYERNAFENIGSLTFVVSGKGYENILFSKNI